MSLEEQMAATEETVAALKERRQAKALAPHHVPIHAFHDMRANIKSIEKEVFFPLFSSLRIQSCIAHNSFNSWLPCMPVLEWRCYSLLSDPLQIASTSLIFLIQVIRFPTSSLSHSSFLFRIL